MSAKKNDHVVIPNCILKAFMEDCKVTILNLDTKVIENSGPSQYNVLRGYYDETVESYLSREIETIIGNIRKKISEFLINNNNTFAPQELYDDVVKIVAVQIARHPDFAKKIKEGSISRILVGIEDDKFYSPIHRIAGGENIAGGVNSLINIIKKGISNDLTDINFVKIDTSKCTSTFILSPTMVTICGNSIFVVLDPTFAVVLLTKETNQKLYAEDGYINYIEYINNKDVDGIAQQTIRDTKDYSEPKIVGLKSMIKKISDGNLEFSEEELNKINPKK